uniref:Uncharacterized protein n=1 Tax=Microviridae sp. ctydc4 TaxID=2827623 RepID=A0A8S5LQ78_9VIRU|nr:MAG TPA: hypothetical protein [Microviridae sp. ctydc4]
MIFANGKRRPANYLLDVIGRSDTVKRLIFLTL